MEYGDAGSIPDKVLQQMGWVMQGIPPEDMCNLSLTELDTIAAFGKYHDLSHKQIEALAEQLRSTWTAKDPEDYTFYDLRAMQHILCGFNRSEIERIHPMAYKEAAKSLGQLMNCSRAVLQALATLALDATAFGSPATWTVTQVNTIGCVLGGLDENSFSSIPQASLAHLPLTVLRYIPKALRKLSSLKLPEEVEKIRSSRNKGFTEEYLHSSDNETDMSHNSEQQLQPKFFTLLTIVILLSF